MRGEKEREREREPNERVMGKEKIKRDKNLRDKEIGKSVKREKLKRENERKREKIRREQKREKIGEKKQELTILCSLVKNWMKAILNSMELLWNYNSNSFVLSKQKIWNFLNPIPQFFNSNANSRFVKRGQEKSAN